MGGDGLGKLDLGNLRGLAQPGRRRRVHAHVDAGLLAEPVGQLLEDALLQVGTAELGVVRTSPRRAPTNHRWWLISLQSLEGSHRQRPSGLPKNGSNVLSDMPR